MLNKKLKVFTMYSKITNNKIDKIVVGDFKQSDLNVYWCGCDESSLPPGNINGPVIRDCHVIQYCLGGKGTIYIDGTAFPIEAGQAFIFFPDTMVLEKADEEDPWYFIWAHIKGFKADMYLNNAGITKESPILPGRNNKNILDLLNQIFYLHDKTDQISELLRTSYAFGLFAEILQIGHTLNLHAPGSMNEDSYIDNAVRYIEGHYFRKIKITDVAKYLGLNRSYFFTLFKKRFGISPQEFLIRFRIKKACDFLSNPGATVSNVAYSVGYDPTVFSPIFKRITGITPTEYKNSIIESNILD